MIVRIYQAKVRPGGVDQLCELIKERTWPLLAKADGYLGGEFYKSLPEPDRMLQEPDTVVMVTRWRDEAAIAAWAGPLWRMRPVSNPEDYQFLAETDRVQHFTVVHTD
jgi:heme-degrading monooxygenase HmoA